jgi:hypothetical protein
MKKIITLFSALALTAFGWQANAQILNQNAAWPNVTWTLSGDYDVAGLLNDPTLSTNFSFNDDIPGSGHADTLMAESPIIDLTGAHTGGETLLGVDFNYDYNLGDVFNLEYYDAATSSWVLWDAIPDNSGTTSAWCATVIAPATALLELNVLNFTPTQLSGFKYRFYYEASATWGWGFCMTSPTITSITPPACPLPSALTASAITAVDANISWTENGTATTWDVEWGTTGFVQGTGTMVTGTTTNPHALTGLTANTSYDYWVRADCGGIQSTWVGPYSFTTPCAAFTAPFLEQFNVATLPACWSESGSNVWEYGSLTGTTPTGFAAYGADGVADHSTPATGTFIGMDGSDNGNGEVSVLLSPYIDVSSLTVPQLNYYIFSNNINDAAQNELTVEIWDGAAWNLMETIQANLGAGWVNYSAILTSLTISGDVQIRFTVTGVANGGSPYYNDILIDDVEIREAPSCPQPNALNTNNVTATDADLAWTEAASATSWEIEWDVAGFTPGAGTSVVTGTNPHNLAGLSANTSYDFYVRAICGPGDTSLWTGPMNFTTNVSCMNPSTLTASNITTTTANLGWMENGTAISWEIEWDLAGFTPGAGTSVVTGTNPHMLAGLTAATSYDFYVRAICGPGDTSAWSGMMNFATPCVTYTPNYLEDFATFIPTCWNEAGDGTPLTGPTGLGAGNWSGTDYLNTPGVSGAKVNLYTTGWNEWLISPTFDLSAGTWELKIEAGVTSYNGTAAINMGSDDTVQVVISTDGGATWAAIYTWDVNNQPDELGAMFTMDLSAYTGTNNMFAVWASDGTVDDAEDFDFHIGTFAIDIPTAVSTVGNNVALTVYPNPNNGVFTLNVNTIDVKELNITVMNVQGQTVYNKNNFDNLTNVNEQIDLSKNAKGVYFINVTSDKGVKTHKVIVQ